jgi:hypothetical protein
MCVNIPLPISSTSFLIDKNMRFYLFIFSLLLLTACSPESEKKGSSTPAQVEASQTAESAPDHALSKEEENMAVLMRAIFTENYRPATQDALAELTDPENRDEMDTYVVTPVAMKYTSATEDDAVLIANAEPADSDGHPISSHAAPGLLNVFYLRKYQGHWEVLKQFENIAALGSSGNVGSIEWVILAPGKPGFGVIHGGTWQGYTISALTLFSLDTNEVKNITGKSIDIASSNGGACGPDTDVCWDVDSKWSFTPSATNAMYNDLVVEFTGEKNTLVKENKSKAPDESDRIAIQVNAKATYAFDGSQYQLVKGENVVPTF